MFRALYADSITLHLINEDNLMDVYTVFEGFAAADLMREEISENYLPQFHQGQRITYGFYSIIKGELAGLNLLGIDDWKQRTGFTGADTLLHMRGQRIAPAVSLTCSIWLSSYWAQIGLKRAVVSNLASKRSIEKTIGFQFEGVSRESGLNAVGKFEDEYQYAILQRDWLKLYDALQVTVIF